MPTTGEIRDALESVGLRELAANQFTQLNADEGFCKGACLDWVRRVLHGRPIYGYTRTGTAQGQKREVRMRDIQSILTGRVFANVTAMDTEMEQRRAALAARVPGINLMDGDAQTAAIAEYQEDQRRLNEDLREYGRQGEMGPLAAGWSATSSQLDAGAAATRNKQPSAMKRPFAGITPVSGSAATNLDTSARVVEAVAKVMRQLAPQSAAIFIFKPQSDIGHAIGVCRTQKSTALFDPAYGMYGGPDVEPAIKGFAYLLNEVYPGSNNLEFTVFTMKPG